MKDKIIEILNNYVDLSVYARGGVDKKILEAIVDEIESICYPKEFVEWCMTDDVIRTHQGKYYFKPTAAMEDKTLYELYEYWKSKENNKLSWSTNAKDYAESFKLQQQKPEEHTTCDGCEMFVDNLCMLDVSVCPDCFERSMWTAQKQMEQKPEAKIDLREELINKVNEQKKVSEKQLSDWSFNDMCEHAIEARGQIMAWDYLIEYLTDKQ